MIDFSQTRIGPLSIHHIGRISHEESCLTTEIPHEIIDSSIHTSMLAFLLAGFKEPAFYKFRQGVATDTNFIKDQIDKVLSEEAALHEISISIAEKLFADSQHPAIKSGEFLMCQLTDVVIEDELIDCIGLFKVETRDTFIKILQQTAAYNIKTDVGHALNGLDKACLILNSDSETGYRVLVRDKASLIEAQFWKRGFLDLIEREDNYHQTAHYISLTKDFVEDKRKREGSITKDEEFAIMNSSEAFFSSQETFDESSYLENLFEDETMKKDFKAYKNQVEAAGEFSYANDFDISEPAVKKNNKVFRSILKLDKNFHVYIHGDKNRIERGEDDRGKYYKLYFDKEA